MSDPDSEKSGNTVDYFEMFNILVMVPVKEVAGVTLVRGAVRPG